MKLRAQRLRWHRHEGPRTRAILLPIALALLNGCAGPLFYYYDTELPAAVVGGKPDKETRVVSEEKAPIPPVKFGQWFMPSSWASRLAARWADLPYVFDATGPEYCTALGVDKDRMLHASAAVRYRDPNAAKVSCPGLIWKNDIFMTGLGSAHSHQTLEHHGERISAKDATLGGSLLAGSDSQARIEMLRVAVHFFSGERLMGIDPATGKEAPVPAQSLLFTRFNGTPHVFMWTPLGSGTRGKSGFVKVYKPAPNDGWEEVGICWIDAADVQRAIMVYSNPAVRCSPVDFWLK